MKLPPLPTLRAFEASARHLNFTRAGDELAVTQGAVSQQVKQLEEYLGFALFHRLPRGLALTDEGREFQEVVSDSLRRISSRAEMLRLARRSGPLTVSVVPSFALKWLIPRLGKFRELHPEIVVHVDADKRRVEFDGSDVDLAVRLASGAKGSSLEGSGLWFVELFRERVFPVCSPEVASGKKGKQGLKTLADLAHVDMLHHYHIDNTTMLDGFSGANWNWFLRELGVPPSVVDPKEGPTFSQSEMLVQAAILGEGVALTRSSLAAGDLKAGRLVRPLKESIPCPMRHFICCQEETLQRPNVVAFRDWLLAEGHKVTEAYARP